VSRDILPAPRLLSQWWNQFKPQQILVGTVTVLRIEALVARPSPRIPSALIKALLDARSHAPQATANGLDEILGLGLVRTQLLLRQAEEAGWLGPDAASLKTWNYERQRFSIRGTGLLPLPDPGHFEWDTPSKDYRVADASWETLQQNLNEEPLWRTVLNLEDELRLVEPRKPAANLDVGLTIPWERCESMPVVLVEAEEVHGYFVRSLDWSLNQQPDFSLNSKLAARTFPELHGKIDEFDLHNVWQSWAKSRLIPLQELDQTQLHYENGEIFVTPAAVLREWLQANRADVFNSEIWLWVGSGELKRSARLRWL
jgi:hypothetical protein